MLNQSLYYNMQYLETNTNSKGAVTTPLVADVAKNSLVTWRLILARCSIG